MNHEQEHMEPARTFVSKVASSGRYLQIIMASVFVLFSINALLSACGPDQVMRGKNNKSHRMGDADVYDDGEIVVIDGDDDNGSFIDFGAETP